MRIEYTETSRKQLTKLDKTTYSFSGYLREGKRTAEWFSTEITKYHRSFGTIITALADAGFIVNTVLEPKPDAEAVSNSTENGKGV